MKEYRISSGGNSIVRTIHRECADTFRTRTKLDVNELGDSEYPVCAYEHCAVPSVGEWARLGRGTAKWHRVRYRDAEEIKLLCDLYFDENWGLDVAERTREEPALNDRCKLCERRL